MPPSIGRNLAEASTKTQAIRDWLGCAYEYAEGLAYTATIDGRTTKRSIGKRDQFAPELLCFSDCILNDTQPEPSAYLVKNNIFGREKALTMKPGMVFSDEPGIYIKGEFGMRLEDDMVMWLH